MGTRNRTRGSDLEAVHPGLGPKLRAAREAAGIQLNEAARRSGINPSQLSRFEREKIGMSIPRFMHLMNVLELRAGDLLDPDVDSRSRFLQMARRVRSLIGTREMQWLADLKPLEARLAMEGAHKEVEYHQRQSMPADPPPGATPLYPIQGGKS